MRQPPRHEPAAIGNSLRNPPPLHCLLAFEAAARNLSLAKAAGELRLTPSAVAQSIAMLEDRLGMQLVRALSPVVDLTGAGQDYFRAVQQFSHNLRDGFYQRLPARRTQLRITAAQALARLWLAPRLDRFVARYPRIDLVLTSTEQLQAIGHGGVDIGLRYGTVDEDDALVATPLWADTMVAAGTPALARRARDLSPAGIVDSLPVIEHPVASWLPWLAAIDVPPASFRPVLTCSDLHLGIEAACQGVGLVVAPRRVLGSKLASGVLRLASEHVIPGRTYHAVVARDQVARLPIREFLQWLGEEIRAEDAAAAQAG